MSEEGASLEISDRGGEPNQKWWLPYVTTVIAVIVIAAILLLIDWWGRAIETNSILIAVLPVVIWLLVAGKITSFKAFGVELKSAINQLSKETIDTDSGLLASSKIDYEAVESNPKEDVSQIQSFIRRRVPALSFEIRRKNYYTTEAIEQWISQLSDHDFFKWVIFLDNKGRFAGLIPRDKLRTLGVRWLENGTRGYDSIKQRIENHNVHDLPGFIGPESAVTASHTKGEAIEKFSKLEADDLPVVDADRKFAGVLNRGKLHSSLLASIFHAARADR